MRRMRASICRWRSKIVSGRTSVAVRVSAPTACVTVSVADTREDVLEAEERLEARRPLEAPAVDGAGVFQEIHRARRGVVEPEAEEPAEDRPGDRLGDGHGRAAGLADRDLQRHRARAGDVEDAVRARPRMRLTAWAMAYSSSRLVPSTFTSCRTSGSPRKWRTKAWWTTASGRSVRNTSSNLRLRMSTTCMRTSAGWPSHGVRSTPMIRQRAPAMRRAMSRPWPPAIPVISTVSIGSATALGGSNAGATRADAAASAKWKSCSGPSTGARAIGGGILILPSEGRNTRGPGGDGAAAPFGVVADRRGHELPRLALQQPRPRRADLQH